MSRSRFINLTPHNLNLLRQDGSSLDISKSGSLARVAATSTLVEVVEGVELNATDYGVVIGLPEPDGESIYVVSGLVKGRPGVAERGDVVSPGRLIRGDDGQPRGAAGVNVRL
jgi:hypothetical protein